MKILLFFSLFEKCSHASVHVSLPVSKLYGAKIIQRDGHTVFQVIASTLAENVIRNLETKTNKREETSRYFK